MTSALRCHFIVFLRALPTRLMWPGYHPRIEDELSYWRHQAATAEAMIHQLEQIQRAQYQFSHAPPPYAPHPYIYPQFHPPAYYPASVVRISTGKRIEPLFQLQLQLPAQAPALQALALPARVLQVHQAPVPVLHPRGVPATTPHLVRVIGQGKTRASQEKAQEILKFLSSSSSSSSSSSARLMTLST
jgi:hypothetical protein